MPDPRQPPRFTVLDGGLGTTLEETGHSVSSHLWSSDPSLREAVKDVHENFMRVGAGMIGTATYQASESLYTANDAMSAIQAHKLMRAQVKIASDAIDGEGSTSGKRKQVGLCLGPFGATLQPGQEYSGRYPSPYGPSHPLSTSSNFPPSTSSSLLHSSLDALKSFHLSRLLVYALDRPTWESIDWICFETIPLVREGVAFRMAVKELWVELGRAYGEEDGWWKKPFWMSHVFPKGVAPDGASVDEIVQASTRSRLDSVSTLPGLDTRVVEAEPGNLPIPSAIGLNCTSPAHIAKLSSQFTRAVSELRTTSPSHETSPPLGFVLYPDGGLVYDTVTRTWSAPTPVERDDTGMAAMADLSWSVNVATVARTAAEATYNGEDGRSGQVWDGGVYVGGCCKSGYKEIEGLAKELLNDTA